MRVLRLPIQTKVFLAGVFIGVFFFKTSIGFASLDDLDIDEPMYSESDGIKDPNQEAYNYFMSAAARATAQAQQQQAQQAQKRPSFFKRLFTRAKKQVSLPIEQVEKIPQQPPEPPKSTPVAHYAMLRLPVAVAFNDISLPAGIYAVEPRLNPATRDVTLSVLLQNRVLLTIPATASSSAMSSATNVPSTSPVVLAPSEDTLQLEFMEGGQRAILKYYQVAAKRELHSSPLDVMTY
jgi:hypothetical protein